MDGCLPVGGEALGVTGEILGYGDKFLGSYVINVIVIVN